MLNKIRKLLKNDFALSVTVKVLSAVLGVLSSAFATRYLGVRYKGDYGYITHVVSIVVLILNMGIYQSYSYNYKKYGNGILAKYLDIIFVQFAVLVCLMFAVMGTAKDPLIGLIALLVPFNIVKLQFSNIILIENIKLSLVMSLVNSILNVICCMLLYFCTDPNLPYMVGVTVLIDVVTVIVFCVEMKAYPRIRHFDTAFLVEVLRFGFIPMLSGLLATINYSIDIIFLKRMGIAEELSYYSLAANIISYVWLIPDAFKSVLFSKTAKKLDRESIEFSSQVSMLFIFFCLICFAVFGKLALRLMYGEAFVNSYLVTLLLISGAFPMAVFKLLGIVLVSQGRRISHFVALLTSAVFNVVLNVLLIPRIGMYGAGIASVVSYSVCGIILLIHFCRTYSYSPLQILIPRKKTLIKLLNAVGLHRTSKSVL